MVADASSAFQISLDALLAENKALSSESARIQKQIEENNRVIELLSKRLGATSGSGLVVTGGRYTAVGVSAEDYGWLTDAVNDYIKKRVGGEFNPTEMLAEIQQNNPERKPSRTSIYPILNRLAESGVISQTQKAQGRRPALYSVAGDFETVAKPATNDGKE